MTRGEFAKKLAASLQIPWTIHNRIALQTWMQSEGGTCANNPLNTTETTATSWRCNFVGVQQYPTPDDGLYATIKTFHSPGQGYGKILKAMRANADARKTVNIIGNTNWGTAKTLMAEVRVGIARRLPWYLRKLERTEISGA